MVIRSFTHKELVVTVYVLGTSANVRNVFMNTQEALDLKILKLSLW